MVIVVGSIAYDIMAISGVYYHWFRFSALYRPTSNGSKPDISWYLGEAISTVDTARNHALCLLSLSFWGAFTFHLPGTLSTCTSTCFYSSAPLAVRAKRCKTRPSSFVLMSIYSTPKRKRAVTLTDPTLIVPFSSYITIPTIISKYSTVYLLWRSGAEVWLNLLGLLIRR